MASRVKQTGGTMPDVQGACSPLGFLIIRASMHPNLRPLFDAWEVSEIAGKIKKHSVGIRQPCFLNSPQMFLKLSLFASKFRRPTSQQNHKNHPISKHPPCSQTDNSTPSSPRSPIHFPHPFPIHHPPGRLLPQGTKAPTCPSHDCQGYCLDPEARRCHEGVVTVAAGGLLKVDGELAQN